MKLVFVHVHPLHLNKLEFNFLRSNSQATVFPFVSLKQPLVGFFFSHYVKPYNVHAIHGNTREG